MTEPVLFGNDVVLNLIINGIPSIRNKKEIKLPKTSRVLNLIINGIPSILNEMEFKNWEELSFKPYYKWNTFNTVAEVVGQDENESVLNLIINGIPSIQYWRGYSSPLFFVLNLIINGIPSIHWKLLAKCTAGVVSFKPYYKWNTFNTKSVKFLEEQNAIVLNLIINGIPSILEYNKKWLENNEGFKPYYKWNTFNTEIISYL